MVNRIEAEMEIDKLTGIVSARYPWKPCVSRMVDNRWQAEKIQRSMEHHMLQAGTHKDFVQEVLKAEKEGKVRKLSDKEMDSWHGPTNYITVFAVVKPGSTSTKTRVVANSAMRNARSGLSVNDCMWGGPNALCELLSCLIFLESNRSGSYGRPVQSLPINSHIGDRTPFEAICISRRPMLRLGSLWV